MRPYPWWEHGEVEEHSATLHIQRQLGELLDSADRSEGLIDSNLQVRGAPAQLGLNIVSLAVPYGGRESTRLVRSRYLLFACILPCY